MCSATSAPGVSRRTGWSFGKAYVPVIDDEDCACVHPVNAFAARRANSSNDDRWLPADETDGVSFILPAACPRSPDREEDVCDAKSFTGVDPGSVCDNEVRDDKLRSSEVILYFEKTYG